MTILIKTYYDLEANVLVTECEGIKIYDPCYSEIKSKDYSRYADAMVEYVRFLGYTWFDREGEFICAEDGDNGYVHIYRELD